MSLKDWIRSTCAEQSQETIFERFCRRFDDHFIAVKAHSVSEVRKNKATYSMKVKGDLFEQLCCDLIMAGGFPQLRLNHLWRLKDLPQDIRLGLRIPQQDVGIDLVGCTSAHWVAIQCKYRKRPNHVKRPNGQFNRWQVTWKDLSTFLALAGQTGPWGHLYVMTSAPSIHWEGGGSTLRNQVTSICRGSFQAVPREIWDRLAGDPGHQLGTEVKDLKEARNTWLDKLTVKK